MTFLGRFFPGIMVATWCAAACLSSVVVAATATYKNIHTLPEGGGRVFSIGQDNRIYGVRTTDSAIWSVKTDGSDFKLTPNPNFPVSATGSFNFVMSKSGIFYMGSGPKTSSGSASTACPATHYTEGDNPVGYDVFGNVFRFRHETGAENIVVSGQTPICPTGVIGIDGNDSIYFASEIKTSRTESAIGSRIYRLAADGSTMTEIHQFSETQMPSGTSPRLVMAGRDGAWIYGINGGAGPGTSYVYRIRADGTDWQVLAQFGRDTGDTRATDYPSMIEQGDYLYGALYYYTPGTGGNGNGTLYRVRKDGSEPMRVLHAFGGTDGRFPKYQLAQGGDGKIYGVTTTGGGQGFGSLYSIDPAAITDTDNGVQTNLFDFTGTDADSRSPNGLVSARSGKLYGLANFTTLYELDIGYTPSSPIIHSLAATPAEVVWQADSERPRTNLTWNVEGTTGSTTCSATSTPEGAWSGTKSLGAAEDVAVLQEGDNTYVLTCDNGSGLESGVSTQSVIVRAIAPPPSPQITTFSVTPLQAAPGTTIRFGWSTQAAVTCRASWTGNNLSADQLSSGWVDYTLPTSEGEHTYTLTCTGRGGDTVSKDVTVLIKAGASVDGGGESASIEVSDGGGPVAPWLLLPLSLLALRRRQTQSVH